MMIALLLVIVAGALMVLSLNNRKWPVTIGNKVVYARVAESDERPIRYFWPGRF